jgi:hypothetical protein
MIFPAKRGCKAIWFYLPALAVILCLIFLFYEAKTRPATPEAPGAQPLHSAK